MKTIMVMLLFCVMLCVSGCQNFGVHVPRVKMATIRDQQVYVGQPIFLIQEQLGKPDWVATDFSLKMLPYSAGSMWQYVVEWGYVEYPYSLAFWFYGGTVIAIYQIETEKFTF